MSFFAAVCIISWVAYTLFRFYDSWGRPPKPWKWTPGTIGFVTLYAVMFAWIIGTNGLMTLSAIAVALLIPALGAATIRYLIAVGVRSRKRIEILPPSPPLSTPPDIRDKRDPAELRAEELAIGAKPWPARRHAIARRDQTRIAAAVIQRHARPG